MADGIGLVPEDRHREGLMLGLSVTENLVMATLVDRQGALWVGTDGGGDPLRNRPLVELLLLKGEGESVNWGLGCALGQVGHGR